MIQCIQQFPRNTTVVMENRTKGNNEGVFWGNGLVLCLREVVVIHISIHPPKSIDLYLHRVIFTV